ncbi:hypothetical protein HK096_006852 [Nowakowskiella sp. JEL0078]|nr:hypothetical protein HK096_006852 [Nowakowskiella sp. JEL0078]
MGRCKGITVHQQQCKKTVTSPQLYCIYHINNCKGTTLANKPCKSSVQNSSGYCEHHDPANLCDGLKRDGQKCHAKKRPDSNYCRDDHNPKFDRSTNPEIFRVKNLRKIRGKQVLQYRGGLDVYTLSDLESISPDETELDHVLEIQCIRDCYDRIKPSGTNFAKAKNEAIVQISEVINITKNLNFTSCEINKGKFEWMNGFLGDYKIGNSDSNGFFSYIYLGGENLPSRKVTRRIQNEIVKSFEEVFGETQTYDSSFMKNIENELFNMKVAMKLK